MGGAIEPAEHPPELREEVMATLDRIANLAHPWLGFATLGGLQAKSCPPCPFLRRAIALGPISLRTWQAAEIAARDTRLCRRRVEHQRVQHVLGLTAIVGIGSSHYDSQRHGPRVTS